MDREKNWKATKMALGYALFACTLAHAGTLQWGTAFDANVNATTPTSGNWSGANWTYRSGTDLGVAGVPDAGDVAQIGLLANNTTITVDGNYELNRLLLRPRNNGFSGKNLTLNSSGGLLRIGSGGFQIDNGGIPAINVPIELTADATLDGLGNNPSGSASFNTTISGPFKITRTAGSFDGAMLFFAGNSTFSGYRNLKWTTRVGNNSASSLSGGGPLGTNTLELVAGTLTVYGTTGRTLHNSVQLEGGMTVGASSSDTGSLTFGTNWGGAFSLYSTVSGTVRALNVLAAVTINQPVGETGGGTALGLVKKGAATLTLGGSASNTFGGGLVVSNGTLVVSKNAACGTGNVTVAEESGASTARLKINAGVASAIGDEATLALVSNAGNFPIVELGAGVVELVKALTLDGVPQAQGRTYGNIGSGADVQSSSWFAGMGVVKVAAPTGTLITLR